jgi:hypothetical protein
MGLARITGMASRLPRRLHRLAAAAGHQAVILPRADRNRRGKRRFAIPRSQPRNKVSVYRRKLVYFIALPRITRSDLSGSVPAASFTGTRPLPPSAIDQAVALVCARYASEVARRFRHQRRLIRSAAILAGAAHNLRADGHFDVMGQAKVYVVGARTRPPSVASFRAVCEAAGQAAKAWLGRYSRSRRARAKPSTGWRARPIVRPSTSGAYLRQCSAWQRGRSDVEHTYPCFGDLWWARAATRRGLVRFRLARAVHALDVHASRAAVLVPCRPTLRRSSLPEQLIPRPAWILR